MKRKFLITFIVLGLLGMTSCENKTSSSQYTNSNISNKGIVVYFSATNNTRRVSNIIANHLNIATFELIPVEPYTRNDLDYNNPNSRVVIERNDPSRHVALVSTTIDQFDQLDYIFIGYPIWWGEASWVLDDFITQNNFEGKTMIPFATSASSSLGSSAYNLSLKSNGGDWLDGMRFSSLATEESIISWVSSLKI